MADDATPSSGLRQRRPSTTETTTSSLLSTATHLEQKAERALLVLWDDLRPWQRDNHFIRRGYRAASGSYARSAASLLYAHNETVNIWTHLLGAVAFAAVGGWAWRVVAPRYELLSTLYTSNNNSNGGGFGRAKDGGGDGKDVLVLSCFFAGAVACLGMSATYHALSNHSEPVAKWGNKLDYSGIVCLIVGSFVPALYYGLYCLPVLLARYTWGIALLGAACAVVSWVERFRTPAWRPYRAAMFVGLGVSGVVPVAHALSVYGYRDLERRMGLSWVLLEGFLYIFGAFLYAARWPERSFPGTFDICGSSHQLFHVLILLAAAAHLAAMAKAFDYHHSVMGSRC